MSAAGGAGEGDGLVAGEADEDVTLAVDHDGVDTARLRRWSRSPSGRRPRWLAGATWRRRTCRGSPRLPGGGQFGNAGGLEAQLDQARCGDESGRPPVRGSAGRPAASSPTVVPPSRQTPASTW